MTTTADNIPPSKTRRKRWSRKPKYRDPHGPRIAHDRTTIMLTLDQRQAALAGQMAKALEALRQHLLDFRDDMHINDGSFPSLGQFGQAAREWNKKQPRDTVRGTVQGRTTRSSSARVLPQGALDATARLVLQRSISAPAEAEKRREQRRATMGGLARRFAQRPRHDDDEPDWDQHVTSIFFTGGGAKDYIRIKDRRLYLPKLGWCPYHSKDTPGDVLAAVLETPGTRIRGATLKLSQGGDYRAVISFEAAPGKLIQQEIAQQAPGALIHRYTQQDMSWVAARALVVERYISPARRAAAEAAEDEPDLMAELYKLFKKPDGGGFHDQVAVSTIKAAMDYKAARALLGSYRVRPTKAWIGQQSRWAIRCFDFLDAFLRYHRGE